MSKIIKKIMPLVICLLMVSVVIAIDEFEITLVAYNAETQTAQIGIRNIGTKDQYDVHMAIDNLQPVKIVGLLRQGNAIKVSKGIPSGKHTITVSTPHGALTKKTIDFPRSQAEIQEKLELKKKATEFGIEEKVEKKTELRVYEKKEKPIGTILTITVILALFLLLVYFIFKKK